MLAPYHTYDTLYIRYLIVYIPTNDYTALHEGPGVAICADLLFSLCGTTKVMKVKK